MKKENMMIRKAERRDVPLLLEFIKGIARYEKMENEVVAALGEDIRRAAEKKFQKINEAKERIWKARGI